MTKMDSLNQYIDLCVIAEYADKSFTRGYSLDVDSLPHHEISNLLDELMKRDTNVRDYVLHCMQKLINSRLPECEINDRSTKNLKLIHSSNGDVTFERVRGY